MKRNAYAPCAKTRKAQADAKRRANFERDVFRACVNECNKRARSYKGSYNQWAIYHMGTHKGRLLPDRVIAIITRISGRVMVSTLDKNYMVTSVTMYQPDTMISRKFASVALALDQNEFYMARF